MKTTAVIFIVGLVTRVLCAPLGTAAVDKKSARVSTKEILDLEQQLKVQAGEDKKFFPSQMRQMVAKPPIQVQQVDGLQEPQEKPDAVDPGSGDVTIGQAPSLRSGSEFPEGRAMSGEGLVEGEQTNGAEVARRREELLNTLADADGDEAQLLNAAANTFTGDIRKETTGSLDSDEAEEEDAEAEGQREDDEALFMQSVADILRDRPDLLEQFLEAGNIRSPEADDVIPTGEDEADRDDVIKAELLEATGQKGWRNKDSLPIPSELEEAGILRPFLSEMSAHEPAVRRAGDTQLIPANLAGLENFQDFRGDGSAREVAKKRGYSPPGPLHQQSSEEMEEEDSEDKSDFISTEDSRHILGNGSDEEDERSEDGYEDSEDDLAALEAYRKSQRVDLSQHLTM